MTSRLTAWLPAVLGLAVAGLLLLASLDFPGAAQPNDPGTAALPRIVGVTLAVLCVVQLVKSTAAEPLPKGAAARRVVSILVMLFMFGFFVEPLGFTAAAILFIAVALWVGGVRAPAPLVAVPIVVSLGLYYTFDELLSVLLPSGVVEGVLPL